MNPATPTPPGSQEIGLAASAISPAILYFGTPVVLITSQDRKGAVNLAPMSSIWWLGWGCMIGLTASAKTVDNLRETGQCVLNLPSEDLVAHVDRIARTTGKNPVPPDKRWIGFEYEPDKFGRAGLTAQQSEVVSPPRVAECPVQLEASVEQMHDFGTNNPLVPFGVQAIELRIERVHVHDAILAAGERDRIDPDRWRPLIMSFRHFYGLSERLHTSRLTDVPEARFSPFPQL
jgi:flavin reductase (DIM6/NTAB) family NADH-FMN oxidoreductase RutF